VLLLAQLRNTRHVNLRYSDLAFGVSGEAAWKIDGWIEPALRVSYYDPNNNIPIDVLLYTTAGVNFYVPNAPARLSLDFTHRIQQSGRELDNDGIELSVQVRF
jgi:hypothetical protein